jgi:hypothetical protein
MCHLPHGQLEVHLGKLEQPVHSIRISLSLKLNTGQLTF